MEKKKEKKTRGKERIYTEDTIRFISVTIKNQNKKLLEDIAKHKELTDEETKEFVNKFVKPQYYIPVITKMYKKEVKQRDFIF